MSTPLRVVKPCPLCGTENPKEEWSAAAEMRGETWQDGYLECTKPFCCHSVDVTINSDKIVRGSDLLVDLWNLTCDEKYKR